LRSNRAGSGNEVLQKKLRRGEVSGLQNKDGIKLIMWKDKRDVLMISTRPSHSAIVWWTLEKPIFKMSALSSHKFY
jgi:hypothetical protein